MEDITMKKTYINPNIEVVKINMHQQMLSGSPSSQTLDKGATQITGSGDIGAHDDDFDW